MSIEAAREAAIARARNQARLDAAERRYHPGQCFPIQRAAYREAYFAALKPARMGRPPKSCPLERKYSSDTMREAPVKGSASSVDSLPTDAAQRRCVAGPVPVSSDTARAGVSS